MKRDIYTYAIENKISYIIADDYIKVTDQLTDNTWKYGYLSLLKKKTKERLVYNKMKEMVKNRPS